MSTGDITVIIPSWDSARVFTAIWEMVRRERRNRAEYIVVGCATPPNLHPNFEPIIQWVETEYALSPVEAMAIGAARAAKTSTVLAFVHDDVTLTSESRGWDTQILDHFAARPQCGLVGFGGGLGFATDDIYKSPYDYRQLTRLDFVSNMREAEAHGRRVTSACQVAALDGFSMIVTREFYSAMCGWDSCAANGIYFHMNDAWISCIAAELGYETWMLPVACHHAGGQTSVGRQADYAKVVERLGFTSPQDLYDKAHERIYKRFQRVLPIRVPHKLTKED